MSGRRSIDARPLRCVWSVSPTRRSSRSSLVYATQPFAADFIAVIVGFIALFAVIGLASVVWAGARTQTVVLARLDGAGRPRAPVQRLLRAIRAGPSGRRPDLRDDPALSWSPGSLVIVGSLAAWLRGPPRAAHVARAWSRRVRRRRRWRALVAGACLTSALAASSTSAGTVLERAAGDDGADHRSGHEVRRDESRGDVGRGARGSSSRTRTATPTPSISTPSGSTSRCRPTSTTFVAIKPTAPGLLEFYCAVPGHRDAGDGRQHRREVGEADR